MKKHLFAIICLFCCVILCISHSAMASNIEARVYCGTTTGAKKIAKKLKKDQVITDEKKAVKSIVKRCQKK